MYCSQVTFEDVTTIPLGSVSVKGESYSFGTSSIAKLPIWLIDYPLDFTPRPGPSGSTNFPMFQEFQSFKSFRCFSRGRQLFHSWFLVEKELESLQGMVGKLSPGDSNLVRLCFAYEPMREYWEQIASKLLHFILGGNHV